MNTIRVLVIAGTMNVGGIENQLMHLLRQTGRIALLRRRFGCTW